MRKSRRFGILLLVCVLSCKNGSARIPLPAFIRSRIPEQADALSADKTNIPAETLHLDQTDEELMRIAQNAQDTLPLFFRHLLRPAEGEGGFRLKYPFRADRDSGFGMEQLWLSDIRFKDGVYYGVLANTPFYIAAMKKGDTVAFSAG